MAAALHVNRTTVQRTRERFCQGGLDAALYERERPGAEPTLDGKGEAFRLALACSDPPEEARRLTKKLECHHTPKHASWLNMNELELAVLSRQCLNRRLALHHRPCAHPAHSPLSGVRCMTTVVLH